MPFFVAQASCLWGRQASCLPKSEISQTANREYNHPPVSQTKCLGYSFSQRGFGIAVGSTSGSVDSGDGDGVGVATGVRTSPLFVVKTPPESVTSSTRYN